MTGNEYQKLAMVTSNHALSTKFHILNGVMGMCGEAGECCDLIKKHYMQGHNLDKDHVRKELGDVLWYIAETATALEVDLDDIMNENIAKLKARYPDGHFDETRSVYRAEGDI